MEDKAKVYALADAAGRITAIDGGYTAGNIRDFSEWVQIDAGCGQRFNLCQSHYLEKGLTDERGIFRYRLENGRAVERTQEEMDGDYVPPVPGKTPEERIAELEAQNEMLTECLLEISEILYS